VKQKISIYVTETIRHTVEIELEEDAMNDLIEELDGSFRDDFAGDLTNGRATMTDGEFELEYYEVKDS
jgi:hypothetical protein